MPKLTDTREAMRIMQTMKVLVRVNHGEKVEDACTAEGISPDIYYQWVSSGDDAIEALQNTIVANERLQLEQIVRTQGTLLTKLINLSTLTNNIKDVLEVVKFLREYRKDLEVRYGVEARQSDAEDYVLRGPNTRSETSLMETDLEFSRTHRATVNVKAKKDGSVDLGLPIPTEIIDIEPDGESV